MFKYFYAVSAVLVAGLVVVKIARRQAAENAFANRGAASTSAPASYQTTPSQNGGAYPPPTSLPGSASQTPTNDSQPSLQSQWSPIAFQTDAGTSAPYQHAATDASQIVPIPLPPVTSLPYAQPNVGAAPPAVQMADGTWRDDGRYVIININGKEMRLLKASSESPQSVPGSLASFDNKILPVAEPPQPVVPTDNGVYLLPPPGPETNGSESVLNGTSQPTAVRPSDGSVHGRLLQKGYPLVNCYVVIVPWQNGDKTDSSIDTRVPLSTTTNEDGFYNFEHVPPGEYKLTWLPDGAKQWIRRIAMRPDVIVHEGQDVTLKVIRMATQTIN